MIDERVMCGDHRAWSVQRRCGLLPSVSFQGSIFCLNCEKNSSLQPFGGGVLYGCSSCKNHNLPEVILEFCELEFFKMDPKHPIEESGSDAEEFVAILERIEAMKKLCTKAISEKRSSSAEKKIIGNSKSAWVPSFEWEDFYARDRISASMTAKDVNGSIKIQERRKEERRGIKQEVQGSINSRGKRARDPVESAPNFPCEYILGKRHSPEFKSYMSNPHGECFDLNSDDQGESELALTVGLPGFS